MRKSTYIAKRLLEETAVYDNFSSLSQSQKILLASTTVAVFMALSTGLITAAQSTSKDTLLGSHRQNVTEVTAVNAIEPSPVAKRTDVQVREYPTSQYVASEKKTVKDVARKFGVSSDTIRWANNITGDEIKPGQEITVPPMNGLEYEVKKGDSFESIAAYYSAEAEEIVSFNGIVVKTLEPGQKIFVPNGEKPKPPRWLNDPSGHGTVVYTRSDTPTHAANAYPWGNCTWYVFNRRAELGKMIPNGLGNARSWASQSSRRGFTVNNSPAVGAVFAESRTNHVAVVEHINADGSILISEMNYNWRLGSKSFRTIPGSKVSRHSYIH